MSQYDLDGFRKHTCLLAASILESQQFPCAVVHLFGEQHGKTVSDGYSLTVTLKAGFLDHLPEVATGIVSLVRDEFHKDNGVFPALALIALLLEDTSVADIADVLAAEFTKSLDKIRPDAKEYVARVAVFGEPDDLQVPERSESVSAPWTDSADHQSERREHLSAPGAESKVDRLIRIRGDERKITDRRILASELSDQGKKDVRNVFMAIQDAANAWVRKEDRFVNPKVLDMALGESLDEFRRIIQRMEAVEGEGPLPSALT